MINNQEKTMTEHLEDISETEDEKLENVKEVNQLEQKIQELEGKIRNKKEKQQVLKSNWRELDSQIAKKNRLLNYYYYY